MQGEIQPGVSTFKASLSQRLVTAQEEYLQQVSSNNIHTLNHWAH